MNSLSFAPKADKLACFLLLLAIHVPSALLIAYSRFRPGVAYLSSIVVLLAECSKAVINLMIAVAQDGWPSVVEQLPHRRNAAMLWRYAVPAFLYTLSNNAAFVAATHLTPATREIASQMTCESNPHPQPLLNPLPSSTCCDAAGSQ
jgi:hypothetical protein